jgi:GDPmannose 4,6-dehydratase
MHSKTAIIFGVNGQDGSYLSELLLGKGYRKVVGVVRRASVNNVRERLTDIMNSPAFLLTEGDITDPSSVNDIIQDNEPDEVYNLAAQSHVGTSFKQPAYTWNANALGTQNILEGIRKYSGAARFYQASTSEMFGSVVDDDGLQRESTELSPNSPYAVAKVAAHHTTRLYREAYGVFACSGILFNHESPRRGEKFVTRKITQYVAKVRAAIANFKATSFNGYSNDELVEEALQTVRPLGMGNLDAKRDWGFAGDYVEAMWMMLQHDIADDYVVATGEAHSVRDFLDAAFRHIGITDWSKLIYVDPEFIRPFEVPFLCGDSTKIRTVLGWKPKVDFEGLVKMMVDNERSN